MSAGVPWLDFSPLAWKNESLQYLRWWSNSLIRFLQAACFSCFFLVFFLFCRTFLKEGQNFGGNVSYLLFTSAARVAGGTVEGSTVVFVFWCYISPTWNGETNCNSEAVIHVIPELQPPLAKEVTYHLRRLVISVSMPAPCLVMPWPALVKAG